MNEAQSDQPIPYDRMMFYWLIYAACLVDALALILSRGYGVFEISLVLAMAGGAWTAVQLKKRWAACLVVALILLENLIFAGAWGAPNFFEGSLTMSDKVLGVISCILEVAALAFYFFGAPRSASAQVGARVR
jgi:hypothetical protein